MTYTMNTTLGELLKDPAATSVLNKYVPGITSNPMVAMVQGMSLNMIVGMPQAAQLGITADKVEAILAEVNARV